MKRYYNLSLPIQDEARTTFQVDDIVPKLSFTETSDKNLFLINSKIDNLRMDSATHLLSKGCLPTTHQKKFQRKNFYPKQGNYSGEVVFLDISDLYEPIKTHFDKFGKLAIDLESDMQCEQYMRALDDLVLTEKKFKDHWIELTVDIDHVQGICFYTGLSSLWKNQKFEAWEYLYFVGLEFSNDLVEWFIDKNISFLGIDSLKFGHSFYNFTGLERCFVKSPVSKDFFSERLKLLKEKPSKAILLANGINLYQSMVIDTDLINRKGYFVGLPLSVAATDFDNISLTQPIVVLTEEI